MDWRARARRGLPYVIATTAGFLLAYVVVFLFIFPSKVVPDVETRMPDVVGMPFDKAQARLDRTGFDGVLGESRFAKSAKMTVLQQDPAKGVVVRPRSKVTLHVSAGPRSGTVPSVVGMTQQQARVAIENAGFDFGSIVTRESIRPRGEVLQVTPAAGQTATLPATVSLAISGGPSTLDIPDLGGRTLPEARRLLEQVGLRLGPIAVDSFSTAAPNTIVGQRPGSGATVPAGSIVRVTIAPNVSALPPIQAVP